MRFDRRFTLIAVLLTAACNRSEIPLRPTVEEPPPLASFVQANRGEVSGQLVRGFYPVEQGAWRWTASSFALKLHPPLGSAQSGAKLKLRFGIPGALQRKVKDITISASIGDTKLPGERFNTEGEHLYAVDVPGQALRQSTVLVEFHLDHFAPAGSLDGRELGVVFIEAGFEKQ